MRMVLEAAAQSAKFSQNIIVSPKTTASSSVSGNRERSVLHRFPRSSSLKSLENLQSQHFGKRHTLRRASSANFDRSSLNPIMLGIETDVPSVWPERERVQQEMLWENIERRANALDFPLSLRMIKKKQQRVKEGINQLGLDSDSGLACSSSFQRAFSSMVAIVLELQGKALQMRETLTSEDLDLLIDRVQTELHRSFAWLFQQVFSQTPTFMAEVMILLSAFCVHSVENGIIPSVAEEEEVLEEQKVTELITRIPTSQIPEKTAEENGEVSLIQQKQQETVLENEAATKNSVSRPPMELEPDNYYEYLRTDLAYQMHLFEDPHNTLLLCNYAQFLHLVAHDYDRAEECYKRAIQIDPSDAMGLTLYANFLWLVRKDLMGAEERYIEAVATEPENPYHASIYANFLWNTGGKDTCFPLDMP